MTERDLEQFAQETPLLAKGSPDMFRTIFDKGQLPDTTLKGYWPMANKNRFKKI